MSSSATVQQRLKDIRSRIESAARRGGRSPQSVRLIAVSKTKPGRLVETAIAAGADIFGENYIQEAREKIEALSHHPVSWHFIGHLQSNKAKYAVRLFDLIHSVDSARLASEIDKQAGKAGKVQDILVQVNVAGEESKSGVSPENTETLLRQIGDMKHLNPRGLMTMPPFFDDPERARPFFRQLRLLRDALGEKLPELRLEGLSMGMTGDFEAAIEEGATLVRIGTAIFGRRE